MLKVLGGVVVGVFVGAVVFEFLNRRNPTLLRGIEDKARRTVRAAAGGFDEGFHRERQARATAAAE
jgi:hypothetical protein